MPEPPVTDTRQVASCPTFTVVAIAPSVQDISPVFGLVTVIVADPTCLLEPQFPPVQF
jgi:hypothetical protein